MEETQNTEPTANEEETVPEGILDFGDEPLPEDTIVLTGGIPTEDPDADYDEETPAGPVTPPVDPPKTDPLLMSFEVDLKDGIDVIINGGTTVRVKPGRQIVGREIYEVLKNAGLA
jgi:hypothetical protein